MKTLRAACTGLWLSLVMTAPLPLAAQGASEAAQQAAHDLAQAARLLSQAGSANDRVKALTATVRAYEAGLGALRDGLRRAAVREMELSHKLAAQDAEIAQLLGVLSALETTGQPAAVAHPGGPLAMARAGMMVASVTPALAQQAEILRADLTEVSTLRALQRQSADTLQEGLEGAQEARAALAQAIGDRAPLPQRFAEDPVRTAILMAATETLSDFAEGIHQITTDASPAPLGDISARIGSLPLPVAGSLLRRAGEADAAGITRAGIDLATRPQALVTAPVAATVRYAGPLRENGLVVILEPDAERLIVLAGLDRLFVTTGQVIAEADPLGLMGSSAETPSNQGEGAGAAQSETLYIEVRQAGQAQDPLRWFATDKG